MQIKDIHNPWRDAWQQASYRGCVFFVEVGGKASGRRTVVHEFPKRDIPWTEDMGRRARMFSVTGYVVGRMLRAGSTDDRTIADYRIARDALIDALESEGPGALVLPTYPNTNAKDQMNVTCTRYAFSERREAGGYCEFEMMFAEVGTQEWNTQAPPNTGDATHNTALDTINNAVRSMKSGIGGRSPATGRSETNDLPTPPSLRQQFRSAP